MFYFQYSLYFVAILPVTFFSAYWQRLAKLTKHTNANEATALSVLNTEVIRYKKLSYCWETVRRESMPRIAEVDVEMTT